MEGFELQPTAMESEHDCRITSLRKLQESAAVFRLFEQLV